MVYKQCWYDKATGCTTKRCKAPELHPWYLKGSVDVAGVGKVPYRGSVRKYQHLLPSGAVEPRTSDEAGQLEAIVRARLVHREPIDPAPAPSPSSPSSPRTDAATKTPATIADAVEAYDKGHASALADKGLPSILKRIKNDLGARPVIELFDRAVVRDFLTRIERQTSHVNSNRHLSRLQHMAGWLRAEYRKHAPELAAAEAPFFDRRDNRTGIKKHDEGSGRDRRVTLDEERALLKAAEQLPDGGMMAGRIMCAIDCGLRRGEMLALRRDDVIRNYRNSGEVVLRVRWATSKTKKERHVPVTTSRLLSFLNDRRFAEFPFGQADGTRVASFRDDWENVLIGSGLFAGKWTKPGKYRVWKWTKDADLHWHDFRHEYASRLADKGVPVGVIRRLLGHASLVTTQRYENAEFHAIARHVRAALK